MENIKIIQNINKNYNCIEIAKTLHKIKIRKKEIIDINKNYNGL